LSLRSWVAGAHETDFPIENLPFGVIVRDGERHLAVRIGDAAFDLNVAARAGLLDGNAERESLLAPTLNELLAEGSGSWRGVRGRAADLLSEANDEVRTAGLADAAIVDPAGVRTALPIDVRDYVDFYASIEHATNLGKILRPGSEPLLPNYRWMPIGYHGRSSTVVPSGTPVARPRGQRRAPDADPVFGPSTMLDFELEVGFITGNANRLGGSLTPDQARGHIFGLVLLNDWSARDIQAWEYQPLGPFLGKSFATTISPWVVTMDALEPYRVPGPVQDPPPLPHLAEREPRAFDIALEASLDGLTISRPNFRAMYWSIAQMLAHVTSNGSRVRAGDLFGSGTVSGSAREAFGSMIELTWRGRDPIALPAGATRAFLEDGDEVVLRGRCARAGLPSIGFGEARGRITAG
jgi:fumarylacetoacetase